MAKSNTKNPDKTNKKALDKKTEEKIVVDSTILKTTIKAKDATTAYTKAVKKLAKNLKIDGFRAGSVPVSTAEKHLKTESIIETALRELLPPIYEQTVKDSKVVPISNPEIRPVSVEKGKDWIIEFAIAQKPELSIDGYQKVAQKAAKEAQKELEKREAESKKAHDHDHKDHDHANHNHSHDEHKPLSEDQKKSFILQSIYRSLLDTFKPKVPELLLKEEINYEIDQLGNQLNQLKMSFEDYLKGRGMTQDQFSQLITSEAVGRLQVIFLNNAVTLAAKLKVEKEDVEAFIKDHNAEAYAESQKNNPDYQRAIAQSVLNKKIADHLLS